MGAPRPWEDGNEGMGAVRRKGAKEGLGGRALFVRFTQDDAPLFSSNGKEDASRFG